MTHKDKRVEFKNVLSKSQKEALFQSAVHDVSIYQLLAHSEIEIDLFQELDIYLWYIWEVVHRFYQRQHRLPSRKELRLELEQRIDDPNDYLEDETVEEMSGFLQGLSSTDSPIEKDTARAYLQQMLSERIWRKMYHVSSERMKVPASLSDILDSARSEMAMAAALSAVPIPSPFDYDQYDPLKRRKKLTPYGVPFIDTYLGGGGLAGEVYLLLGPTGGGKTSLMQQLSVSLAALERAKWERGNKRQSLGVSYFVSYEMPGWEIMARFYANFAQIDIQKFFEGAPLTRRGELSPQEQVLFARAIEHGVRIPSEKERYDHARTYLRHNWRLLDYSGVGLDEEALPDPAIGSHLFPEIEAHIAADLEYARKREQKRHVAGIFLDYVGMMALRHCQIHDKDPSKHLRIICAATPQDARTYLSHRFRCPVFLAHQLNAAANKLKPGQIADKTDAQESKTIADNCNVVFVLSRPTEDEHRLVRMNRQKGRRMPGMGPCVLQVQGQYARIRQVESLWSWDDLTRQFIPQSAMDISDLPQEETEEKKPIRFDGQEFDIFKLTE
jgi:energy-coupling factor transporter ATP-binding protein EcfA2